MSDELTIGIIGDYDETYTLHLRTDEALVHAGARLGVGVRSTWYPTRDLEPDAAVLGTVHGVICSPGSPYASMDGAINGLRFGREQRIPTLGTCGGCQHMILEFARNVLELSEVQHAEYHPDADDPIVSELACSLVGRTGHVKLRDASTVREIYGEDEVAEQYFCSFGLNTAYERALDEGGLAIVGRDAEDGVARVLTVEDHPFYVATLFVPQARSTAMEPHPLILALLAAARDRATAAAGARA
ncbi:MAG: hypothetical protein V7607_4505 [Solirubrobacteraceae bacterium]